LERDIQEIKVVCFRLGAEIYALDIMRVREIIKPLRLSGLPDAPTFVEGVINLRGSVIPVVDLRKRFGLTEPADRGEKRFLITVVARQPLALVVDAVLYPGQGTAPTPRSGQGRGLPLPDRSLPGAEFDDIPGQPRRNPRPS